MSSLARNFHSSKETDLGYLEIKKDSDTLIISFAGNGLNNMINIPIFEFNNF